MKSLGLVLLVVAVSTVGTAAEISGAARTIVPEIIIGLNTDAPRNGGALGALEPTLKWKTSRAVGDVNLAGGVDLTVQDVDSMPYAVWGVARTKIEGIDLSARVDVASSGLDKVNLDLQASNGPTSIQIKGVANVDNPQRSAVNKIKLTQKLSALGGKWKVIPSYNVKSKKPDLAVSYSVQDTTLTVEGDANQQKVTVAQKVGADNTVIPSITTAGDVELQYRRALPDNGGTLSATYKPDSHVAIGWGDGVWQANVEAPLSGLYNIDKDGMKINIKRSVDLLQ